MNKVDFAVIISVRNANPNGDPMSGNSCRVNNENLGVISDVCLKRKLRDRLAEAGYPIFVQSDSKASDGYTSLKARADGSLRLVNKENACAQWFDVRAFGQLLAWKSADKKDGKSKSKGKTEPKATPEAASDIGMSLAIRGPVTIQSAFSVEPIDVQEMQITKSVNSEDGKGKGSDTMGLKYTTNGVYVTYGSIFPLLAVNTGFTEIDAAAIKATLPKLFENDASSARPGGSMRILKVVWWEQPDIKYSSGRVHDTISVSADGSYQLANLPGLIPEEINGF